MADWSARQNLDRQQEGARRPPSQGPSLKAAVRRPLNGGGAGSEGCPARIRKFGKDDRDLARRANRARRLRPSLLRVDFRSPGGDSAANRESTKMLTKADLLSSSTPVNPEA